MEKRKVQNKTLVTFVLSLFFVAVIPLACGWAFYLRSDAIVRAQQETLVRQSLDMMREKLDGDMQSVINTAFSLRGELRSLDIPEGKDIDVEDRLNFYLARKQLASAISRNETFVSFAYLMKWGGSYAVTNLSVMEKEALYKRYYVPSGVSMETFDALHVQKTTGAFLNLNGELPLFVLTFTDAGQNRQWVQLLSKSYFSGVCRAMGLENAVYTVKNGEEIFLSSSARAEDTAYTDVSVPLAVSNFTLSAAVPRTYFVDNANYLRILYFSMLAVSCVLLAAIIYFLTRKHAVPISALTEYLYDQFPSNETLSDSYTFIRKTVDSLKDENIHQKELIEFYQESTQSREFAEMLLGIGEAPETPDGAYVIACFPTLPNESKEDAVRAVGQFEMEGTRTRLAFVDDSVYLMIRQNKAEAFSVKQVKNALKAFLLKLDETDKTGHRVGLSAVHTQTAQLSYAYHEANLAADALYGLTEEEVVCVEDIKYTPEFFLRDYHHLDHQLSFSGKLAERRYADALKELPFLFPEEFVYHPQTTMAAMHLSALKYQFLHDMDVVIKEETDDANPLIRLTARKILSCRDQQELFTVMQEIVLEFADEKKAEEEPGVQTEEIKKYIRRHSRDGQLSVASVAENFHMKPNTLSKNFSRAENMGVLQYIHKIRIEDACNLLLQDDSATVGEIAKTVGYASVLTFNRAFKARYNMTPGEYRKIHRADEENGTENTELPEGGEKR